MKSSNGSAPILDWIFASISMLGVFAFLGIVMWFVREPDLIIVVVAVLSIAVLYIWRELRAGGSHMQHAPKKDQSGD